MYIAKKIKAPRAKFGNNKNEMILCPKYFNNCLIKHKLYVPLKKFFACFEENCAQTWAFPNTSLNVRGHHLLFHEKQKGVTSVFILLHLLKFFVITYLRVRDSTWHYITET